ncbi:hypothetical protein ABK040_016894 [Willaertia magna]
MSENKQTNNNKQEQIEEELKLTEEELLLLEQMNSDDEEEELKPFRKEDPTTTSTKSSSSLKSETKEENLQKGKKLGENPSFIPTLLDPVNTTARNKFLITSILMFTIPFLIFYTFYFHIFPNLTMTQNLTKTQHLTYSAIASLISVQFIIGGFIYSSLTEKEPIMEKEEEERKVRELQFVRSVLRTKGDLKGFSGKKVEDKVEDKEEDKKEDKKEMNEKDKEEMNEKDKEEMNEKEEEKRTSTTGKMKMD